MAHIFKEQFKIFKAAKTEDLEKSLNDFAMNHDINSVDVKPHSFSQKGTMLCDRINPMSDTATIYIATVSYQIDYTEKMVNEGLREWAGQKLKSEWKKCEASPLRYCQKYDCVSVGDNLYIKIAESIKNSQEYANVRNHLEKKYSEKD